jgi:hypothetical protein
MHRKESGVSRTLNSHDRFDPGDPKSVKDDMAVQKPFKSNLEPATIRANTMPIHHHIAPAIGTPFMRADGLVHRGLTFEDALT